MRPAGLRRAQRRGVASPARHRPRWERRSSLTGLPQFSAPTSTFSGLARRGGARWGGPCGPFGQRRDRCHDHIGHAPERGTSERRSDVGRAACGRRRAHHRDVFHGLVHPRNVMGRTFLGPLATNARFNTVKHRTFFSGVDGQHTERRRNLMRHHDVDAPAVDDFGGSELAAGAAPTRPGRVSRSRAGATRVDEPGRCECCTCWIRASPALPPRGRVCAGRCWLLALARPGRAPRPLPRSDRPWTCGPAS